MSMKREGCAVPSFKVQEDYNGQKQRPIGRLVYMGDELVKRNMLLLILTVICPFVQSSLQGYIPCATKDMSDTSLKSFGRYVYF